MANTNKSCMRGVLHCLWRGSRYFLRMMRIALAVPDSADT